MKVILNKLKCLIGWHQWTCKMQDFIDEFGYITLDSKMPRTTKCSRCNKKYYNESKAD